MKKTFFVLFLFFIIFNICFNSEVYANEEMKNIELLSPQTEGGMPLMKALKNRKSMREYASKELPLQTLSNLLWAAFGVNRTQSNKRTAPSTMNFQEIDIYVSKADGLYLYDANSNLLKQISNEDKRNLTGVQEFVKDAPINLIYVADYSKMTGVSEDMRDEYASADASFISQNVYLFCASEGLATVVRGWIEKEKLSSAMNLRFDQEIIFAQTVGYPKK